MGRRTTLILSGLLAIVVTCLWAKIDRLERRLERVEAERESLIEATDCVARVARDALEARPSRATWR